VCYVGMTRARAELYLLRAERRLRFGTISERPASRFLDEIPQQHVKLLSTPGRPAPRVPIGPTMDYSYSQLSESMENVGGGGLPAGPRCAIPRSESESCGEARDGANRKSSRYNSRAPE